MLPFHILHIDTINMWFENHLEWAGVAIVLLTAGESIPVVGLFIPGTAFMLAVLTLLSLGILKFWPLFFWMTFGAILGDSVGYHLGQYYKDSLHSLLIKRIPARQWNRAEKMLADHGMWAIALSRFIPVLRAFMPALAGIGGMPLKKFYIANVLSAVAWVLIHLFAGEIFNSLLLWAR